MYPHRIRLRGPWECDAPIGKVAMPGRWSDFGLAGFRGSVRFIRKFGYPGKADPDLEHIWITCSGCTGCRDVRLNGQLLATAPGDSFAFDVTRLLGDRNQLEITIDGETDDAGLWGDVALEIRKDAYLSDVQIARAGPVLRILGAVVGVAPRPLELYTLIDNRNADYRTIMPTPEGTRFVVELTETSPGAEVVRVELIHISEIWYAIELPVSRTR